MSRNKTWFTIRNAATADAAAEISIHDEIGSWGVSAKDFLAQLRSIAAATPIHLSLHSPGGEVFDGLAIYHALKARGNVTVRIEGLAASMASVIAMAGTRIEMPRNAFLMIHNPSGFAMGDAADMRQLADLLDKIKSSLVAAYRDRTKKTDEDIMDMMDAETWLTGEEAVEHGFADATTDEVALSASAFKTARITAALRHAPRALFDTPPPVAPITALTSTTEHMKALLALASALGIPLPENCTEDQAVEAFKAHKPAAKNVVIDFEDADVKAAFTARITDATQADKAKITALETELASIKALLTNGPAAAAGGNTPVTAAAVSTVKNVQEQYAAITDPAERTRFYNKHKGELKKPSAYFNQSAA
jgi:ATP-dependent protease ClpP protease subunit